MMVINIYNLRWRHHGVGMLQAYLTPARRLHIWHRSLIKPGIVHSGAKHNHRFELHSRIVWGELLQTRLFPEKCESGDYQLWEIQGAPERSKAKLVPGERVDVQEAPLERFLPGDLYVLPIWDYHWGRQPSEFDGVTVTIVDRLKKSDEWAKLIAPIGKPPVHAFDEVEDKALVEAVLRKTPQFIDTGSS